MLYNLKLALKNEFKITSEFALCEDEDRELELDDIEDMKTAFDDIDDDKKNSSFVMTLYIRVSNNDQKEDYKEQQVNLLSFNVDKKESNNIIKFHKLIFSCIFSKKQSHVTDIQSKSFINGFHCLNLLRKIMIKHLEEKQKAQIEFWKNYTYFYLIKENVLKCMKLKISVPSEIYQTDKFKSHCSDEYTDLLEIIVKYQKSSSTAESTLITDLKINVHPDMIPTEPNVFNTSSQRSNSVEIKSCNEYFGSKEIRIYLLSAFSSAFVRIPHLSHEWFHMKPIGLGKYSVSSPYILFLDVTCTLVSFQTMIEFGCQRNNEKFVLIKPDDVLTQDDDAFYYYYDTRNTITQIKNEFTGAPDVQLKAMLIIKQLFSETKDYNTFIKSRKILKSCKYKGLTIASKEIEKVWEQKSTNIIQHHSMLDVFYLQLIAIVQDNSWELSISVLYHMIKTYFTDHKIVSRTKSNTQIRHEIGMTIYECFKNIVYNYHFDRKRLENVTSYDYLYLHTIYNFFKYFEKQFKRKCGKHGYVDSLIFHHFHKDNLYFMNKNTKVDVTDILKTDLDILSLDNGERKYPFEATALQLSLVHRLAGESVNSLKDIFTAISSKPKKQATNSYNSLFNLHSEMIFQILGDDFILWLELIKQLQKVDHDIIIDNHKILKAFQHNFKTQIILMSLVENKLRHVNKIMKDTHSKTILDTTNIRLYILRNRRFIVPFIAPNINADKFRNNLRYILEITLRDVKSDGNTNDPNKNKDYEVKCNENKEEKKEGKDDRDEEQKINVDDITAELTKFISILLKQQSSINIALSFVGKGCLDLNDEKLIKVFKTSMKNVISKHHNVADRVITFMQCEEFYKANIATIHDYFIEQVFLNGDNKQIQSWDDKQTTQIQNIATTFAKINNTATIDVWNGIFKNSITLSNQDEKCSDNLDEEKHIQDKLRYCLSVETWLKYALKNRHIPTLNLLIQFAQRALTNLAERIAEKSITIYCLEFLNSHSDKMKQLFSSCQCEMDLKVDVLDSMFDCLSNWKKLRKSFRIFLSTYTRETDAITDETAVFNNFLKNWSMEKYANVEKREEWNQWLNPSDSILFLELVESSTVFHRSIWCKHREILDDHATWNIKAYLGLLYKKSKDEWDSLIIKAKGSKLTFKDRKYFEKVQVKEELKIMQLSDNMKEQIKKDMSDSLLLEEYVCCVEGLISTVNVFVENGHTNIRNRKHTNWYELLQTCKEAIKQKANDNQKISSAAELYRTLKAALNTHYSDINKIWIMTVVTCKDCINKLRNEDEFEQERLFATLQLLDDSNNGQIKELSASLRTIHRQFTDIWKRTFDTKIDLMRYLAQININQSDIKNLLEVHDALPKIKNIVNEIGKKPEMVAMEKLDDAMLNGYFIFSDQNDIQKCINDSNHAYADITSFATSCFKLNEFDFNKIQNMMDIVLLCRKNKNRRHKDDEKREENSQTNIEQYRQKIDICKEISELRAQYIVSGGRMDYDNETLKADENLDSQPNSFNQKLTEWKHRVSGWNEYVFNLRNNSHLFNYFTINKVRVIISLLNEYQKSNKGTDLLFQQLLAHFRFIRPDLPGIVFAKIIKEWKFIDSESNKSLAEFNKQFNCRIILNTYKQKTQTNDMISVGQPNLMLASSEKEAVSIMLKLYYDVNNVSPPANQILICNKSCTSEDIEIFVLRCLQNEQRFKCKHLSSIPLYCLVFPEYLNISVLDRSLQIFEKYLLNKNQKPYRFLVISCDQMTNSLCSVLGQYKISQTESQLPHNDIYSYIKTVCDSLFFHGANKDILKSNKLCVKLFRSRNVGAGKSFFIQQLANKINQNLNEEDNLIKIPINGSNINLDFIINRLEQCYDNKKRSKIIYHIDISSSASDSINILLFNLLFLKYISTSGLKCFSVTFDMVFLIELPTSLASLKSKEVKNEFYLLHSPFKFAAVKINRENNPFQYNINCHYAAKFLQYFLQGDLKTKDPNPKNKRVSENIIKKMITRQFSESDLSPIHQKALWQYLFTQFQQVVHSTLIKNKYYVDERQFFKQWKHLVTDSIIDLAVDFCNRLYLDDEKQQLNELQSFHLVQKWKDKNKPIVLLNQSIDGSISFLVSDINKMELNLKRAMDKWKFSLLGWKQQDHEQSKAQKIKLLLRILGTDNVERLFEELLSNQPYCDYALTYDNMIKMVAIFFRIKANISVILIGETGCGKTCLLNYLAKAANTEIETVNVHGGYKYRHIKKQMNKIHEDHKKTGWLDKSKKKLQKSQQILAQKVHAQTCDMEEHKIVTKAEVSSIIQKQHEMQKTSDLWIFLDEVNTSSDIGYFKEIVCDGSFDGKLLPKNIKIIAACNPYRKRKTNNLSQKFIIDDPLSQTMYRVYPLPETMKEYVWMFGSLSKRDEEAYAYQMCQTFTQQLDTQNWYCTIKKMSAFIVQSQQFVRNALQDSAFVSLRDITRCLKIFLFTYKQTNNMKKSLIKALALVYYFRLNDKDRTSYNTLLSNNIGPFCSTVNGFIDEICKWIANSNGIPSGVALNRSLRENLFMLLTCIQTNTPLILVGKPGSSKTLAMAIVRDFLSDKNLDLLKTLKLKPIHVISFQCSTQSKAEGIEQRWLQTEKYAIKANKDVISVLLLDEIGLAEHSSFKPLKVLHQLLEKKKLLEIDPPTISFVGLSNWPLDAAKMNRVVMHLCPQHTVQDLKQTAKAMAKQHIHSQSSYVESTLRILSQIYTDIIDEDEKRNTKLQPRDDFFGARDFYALVKHFLVSIKNNKCTVSQSYKNAELIIYLLRSFGGIDYESLQFRTKLIDIIESHTVIDKHFIETKIHEYSPPRLIQLNLNDKRSTIDFQNHHVVDNFIISRHVMIITQYISSWKALLDLKIINHDDIYIFGSEFERDKTNNVYLHLNRIRNCMETGQTLILCNLEEIHESLYDMLNQRYTFIKNCGKMYCRIALGSNSQTCFVDPSFKCIVISTKKDTYKPNGIPIAFLNRFEKQLISYKCCLSTKSLAFLHLKLIKEIRSMYCLQNISEGKSEYCSIFPGFCEETFPSLLLNTLDLEKTKQEAQYNNDEQMHRVVSNMSINPQSISNPTDDPEEHLNIEDEKINTHKNINKLEECCKKLIQVTLPEKLVMSVVNNAHNNKTKLMKYLPTLQQVIDNNMTTSFLIILTFDYYQSRLNELIKDIDKRIFKKMSDPDFSKAEKFETFIRQYLEENDEKNNLLLQYRYTNMNHYIHIKHIIESNTYHFSQSSKNKTIILLVHLHRDKYLHEKFALTFSSSSTILFLDSLQQKQPIELSVFSEKSLKDVCQERGIQLLQDTFQTALSHLQFDGNINIENEINKLSYLLSNPKNSNIQRLIFDRFIDILSNEKINENMGDVAAYSVKNKKWIEGSFYEKLNEIIFKISVTAMIRVLQTLYTNFNVNILQNSNCKAIIDLFEKLYQDVDIIRDAQLTTNIESVAQKKPDKLFVTTDYNAKFPFSHIIHSWCLSQREKITLFVSGNEMDDLEQEKYESKEVTVHNPCDESEEQNDTDEEHENTTNLITSLKQEIKSFLPMCNGLSIDLLQLYARDLLLLNYHDLQIDKSQPDELSELNANLLLITAMCFRDYNRFDSNMYKQEDEKSNNVQNIEDSHNEYDIKLTIADLEVTIWCKHEFLRHLIKISCVLTYNQMRNIANMIQFNSYAIFNTIELLLENITDTLNNEMYQKFNANSMLDSIEYIICVVDNINETKVLNDIHAKFNIIKIKLIVLRLHLQEMDKNAMAELCSIFHEKTTLFHHDILTKLVKLLVSLINDVASEDKVQNEILYELLMLMNNEKTNDNGILEYAQFLIDLLCQPDKIIENNNALNTDIENEIVRQLLAILARDTFQSDDFIQQIENDNKELAKTIKLIINKKDEEYKMQEYVSYVRSQNEFNQPLIIVPVIAQFNKNIYQQLLSNITTEKWLRSFEFDKKTFPILSQLKQQDAIFWQLHKLPVISNWIQTIHSKYMGTITETGAEKLKMNKIFQHFKTNKWDDEKQCKNKFETYKKAMNSITICAKDRIVDSNESISILSSLIAKNGHKIIKNNLRNIQNMIDLQNNFIDGEISVNCNFFNLTSNMLIDTMKVLNIILANAKPWIGYDSTKKLLPKPYVMFNLQRIENEIKYKCINNRTQLTIQYQDFEYIASKNMLLLIQSIKTHQEPLNYETWHLFDKQFASNMQRKKALNVIEDVISLMVSSKSNKRNIEQSTFQFEDENKENDEKYDNELFEDFVTINNPNQELCKFMQHTLKFNDNKCKFFTLPNTKNKIQLKHVMSLWNELVKRIDGEMTQYQDKCLLCCYPLHDETPIILECCGLKVHYQCLKEFIEAKFKNHGHKISLQQLSCMICQRQMKHKSAIELFKPINKLYDKVKRCGLNRLKLDQKENDIAITDEKSEYYNNPEKYAMKLYSFFICYKCKQPYFGGANECEENIDEYEMNPKNRLCAQCCPPQQFNTKCEKHGDEFISWKCKFCCNVASWFCRGDTHFCQSCHRNAAKLWNMERKGNKLTQCPCISNNSKLPQPVDKCPLNVSHPPHGNEYCLGCAACDRGVDIS